MDSYTISIYNTNVCSDFNTACFWLLERTTENKMQIFYLLKELQNKINEIQDSINYIHWKQGFYDDVLSGKTKYYSNLVQTENDV